jgi:hypothetical protein
LKTVNASAMFGLGLFIIAGLMLIDGESGVFQMKGTQRVAAREQLRRGA